MTGRSEQSVLVDINWGRDTGFWEETQVVE
jgi:hypothetical protein